MTVGRSARRARRRGRAHTSPAPRAFRLRDFSGLYYAYDNSSGLEGALSSLVDRSTNGRTLSVSGTSSARPQGFPRNWEQNGQPVFGFDGGASQYAQDQAGDSVTYANVLHQSGLWFYWRGEILNTGPAVLFGNWGGASSNQNALSVIFGEAGAETVTVYVTSKTGGGTVHIAAVTSAGQIRVGDVVTLIFRHETNKSWTLAVTRESRFPGNAQFTETVSGSYGSTIDGTASTYGLTLGSHGPLAAFNSFRVHSMAIGAISNNTTAELAAYKSATAGRCDVSYLTFDGDSALAYPTDYADATHWDDSGHSKAGILARTLEQAVATARGFSGTVKVGCVGDSRYMGTGASAVGTTDVRAIIHAGTFTYTRSAVGPVDDGSGAGSKLHFARSGYVTRSAGAQTGHSHRTAHAASIDAYVGSGKSYNDTRLWQWCIGVNDLSGGNAFNRDFVDEFVRIVEYLVSEQGTQASITPGFVLLNEPVTGTTTTGPLQRLIRARNRAYHAAVAHLRRLTTVQMGNLNDTTYHA